MPLPNRPHLVLEAQRPTSKDVRTVLHKLHFESRQHLVSPLSPSLQMRDVPCHLRCSLPAVINWLQLALGFWPARLRALSTLSLR